MSGVEISALIDGVRTDLGAATLNGRGAFAFFDPIGAVRQDDVVATLTDTSGGTASVRAGFSLQAGIAVAPYAARQDSFDPATGALSASTFLAGDGSVLCSGIYASNSGIAAGSG